MTIGIDGGFVRAAYKAGFFEVIAGKSVIEFRHSDEEQKPSSKCFSFVQTFDAKPRRRLWELLKSQGMAENQQVVFLSDGGDSVRNLQEYIHPYSEHWIDWFHITMRITVLLQQVKGLEGEQPELGQEVARELNSIKHFLWHGNTFQALQRLESLLINLEFPETPSDLTRKMAKVLGEFQTYISNNEGFIPNFGERRRNGEMISTAFVESTVNQVISKRMVKKQQMRWTQRGAHLLLQIRTKVLNNELEEVFRHWYPQFRAAAASTPAFSSLQYLAAGYPIATGVIEGTCRYLVKDRMELTGARWSLAGAEAVLQLRALRASGDFEQYWKFHLAQEQQRHHAKLYAEERPLTIKYVHEPEAKTSHLRLVK